MLQISGKCNDCDSNIELFDKGASSLAESRRRDGLRMLQGDTGMSLLCLCPSDVPRRSSTEEEFSDEYSEALKALPFVIELEAVAELDPLLCCGNIVSFSKTLIVELEIFEAAAFDQDIAFIEESFVSTYNALAMEYCDPDFRFLETARVVEQGALTPAGNFPVRLEVTGNAVGAIPTKPASTTFPPLLRHRAAC
jgi:hypothetical protein